MVNTSTSPITPNNQTETQRGELYPDVATVLKVCPGASQSDVEKYLPGLLKAMATNGLTSKNQLVAIIATIHVETGGFDFAIREIGGKSKPYAPFDGRGPIQFTHDYNYEKLKEVTGIDVVSNPDRVLDPDVGTLALIKFWKGELGNRAVAPFAEKGNWDQVRRVVNGGTNGIVEFRQAVERGLKYFQAGVDPNAAGLDIAAGNAGLGDIDTGGATSQEFGNLNPKSMADAVQMALGLSQRYRYDIRFEALINVLEQPDVLKLKPGMTFEGKNFGGEADFLDGHYKVEEIQFVGGNILTAHIIATMPDPDLPPPQIFRHDTTQPLTNPGIPAPAPTDIPGRIWAAAKQAWDEKRSSRSGPSGGKRACAWVLNRFCLIPARIKPLGGGEFGSDAVRFCIADLQNGRGQKITPQEAVPGDIWADLHANQHIGVVATEGATHILSNSSRNRAFTWYWPLARKDSYYGGTTTHIYRVTS